MKYEDGRPVSPTGAITSKIKGQCRKVTWCIWQVLADKSRMKRPRYTKIGREFKSVVCPCYGGIEIVVVIIIIIIIIIKVAHPTGYFLIMCTSFKVKGQQVD